jgi:hypothetical protein
MMPIVIPSMVLRQVMIIMLVCAIVVMPSVLVPMIISVVIIMMPPIRDVRRVQQPSLHVRGCKQSL